MPVEKDMYVWHCMAMFCTVCLRDWRAAMLDVVRALGAPALRRGSGKTSNCQFSRTKAGKGIVERRGLMQDTRFTRTVVEQRGPITSRTRARVTQRPMPFYPHSCTIHVDMASECTRAICPFDKFNA